MSCNHRENDQSGMQRQRPQYNLFVSGIETALNATTNFFIPAIFPVKEVRYSIAYNLHSSNEDVFYLTCDMPNCSESNVIASLNNYAFTTGTPNFVYIGDFSNNKTTYLLREPTVMNGQYSVSLKNIGGISPAVALDFLLHIELLG